MKCNIENKDNFSNFSKNILVVEDSRMVNNLLKMEFTKDCHHVMQAFSIAEAKELLSKNTFDLITLDLHLPDGRGHEIIKLVKDEYENIKIIILTGNTNESERHSLFSLGILDYYVKDATIKHSISEINNLVRNIEYSKSYKILLVDDSAMIRTHLKLLLEPRSFDIYEAINGKDALEIFKKEEIDLVLLDMELPDIHGLKVLEKIKASKKHKIPVIVLSGSEDSEVVRSTYKLGVAEFIHKPYVPEELLIKVDQWLNRYLSQAKLECSMQLMKEYQETIDENNIVSKTDARGIITFVNQEFCEISGYTEEELLGKPHSIIHHPEMLPEIFTEMWETLQENKP